MPVELTADEAATLDQYGQALAAVRKDIARAKAAGLDTTALEQNLARIDSVRKGLLKQFAPGSASAS